MQKLKKLNLQQTREYDLSKIVISARDTEYTGKDIYNILLKKYHLQMEMAAGSYVLGMTSVADTPEGMQRLHSALLEIDRNIVWKEGKNSRKKITQSYLPKLDRKYTSAELRKKIDISKRDRNTGNLKSIAWEISEGYVSAEYAYIYPPGVPLIVPGEQISKEVQLSLYKFRELGFQIQGLKKNGKIEVWIDA